jgi:hypothetical protein
LFVQLSDRAEGTDLNAPDPIFSLPNSNEAVVNRRAMERTSLAICVLAGVVGVLALAGAQQPPAWAQAQPGMWEISGVPGAKGPLRQCLTNVAALAQYEHRGKNCTPSLISNNVNKAVVEYHCGAAGFSRSQVDVITPRSLRIDTQGISAQEPFSYVLQARRVGDCLPQPLRH